MKSENVEDDTYLLTVIRYIHRNPVKAGIIEKPEAYPWSSCSVYLGGRDFPSGLTKTSFILSLFQTGKHNPYEVFSSFMEDDDDLQCLDYVEQKRIKDKEAAKLLAKILGERSLSTLKEMPKIERDDLLRRLKNIEGVTIVSEHNKSPEKCGASSKYRVLPEIDQISLIC